MKQLLGEISPSGDDSARLQLEPGSFSETLGIGRGITAVIGSGGKTTTIARLANELKTKGTVVVTTTTHVFPFEGMPLVTGSIEEIGEVLKTTGIVCACGYAADAPKKYSAPECGIAALAGVADYVLVEADGSRMLPIKAHNDHEPVIPDNTENLVIVVGMNGLGHPIGDIVHRPELFCERSGAAISDIVTAEHVAKVLSKEIPVFRTCGKISLFLNRVETQKDFGAAERISSRLKLPCFVGSAALGEIRKI